jgi:hypothetical protein
MQNQADFKLVFVMVVEELDRDPRLVKFTDLDLAKVVPDFDPHPKSCFANTSRY